MKLNNMMLSKPIKVKHIKSGKMYKITGFVVDCTNASDDEIMVEFKHLSGNEDADFVRVYAEFIEKYEVDTQDFVEIFEQLKNIYTTSRVSANKPPMPKLTTFNQLREYVISNKKNK